MVQGEYMLTEEEYFKKNFNYSFEEEETVLTPVPMELSVSWMQDVQYYFDNVFDGSSLLWVSIMHDTFNELYPEVSWGVDDPGTLYADVSGYEYEDADYSPYDLDRLQEITGVCLSRYAYVFEKLEEAGVPVVSDKEGY